MKKCPGCKEEKPESEFHKSKSRPGGLKSACKKCRAVDGSAYHRKESTKKRLSVYYKKRWAECERYRELCKVKSGIWNSLHKDHVKDTKRARYHSDENYKKSTRAYNNQRYKQKCNAEGIVTGEEWLALKKHYGFTCLCCRKSEPEIRLTQDHVIPLSAGGANIIENIQPLCRSCNSKKRNRDIDFRKHHLFLEPWHD